MSAPDDTVTTTQTPADASSRVNATDNERAPHTPPTTGNEPVPGGSWRAVFDGLFSRVAVLGVWAAMLVVCL